MEDSPRIIVDLAFCSILILLIVQVATSLEREPTLVEDTVKIEAVRANNP